MYTWEVDRSINRCTCSNRGMDQVRVLQPEPGSERAWVRPTECQPLPVGQALVLSYHSAKVSQVSQRLTTAEETQVVCAEVTEWREERTLISSLSKHALVSLHNNTWATAKNILVWIEGLPSSGTTASPASATLLYWWPDAFLSFCWSHSIVQPELVKAFKLVVKGKAVL